MDSEKKAKLLADRKRATNEYNHDRRFNMIKLFIRSKQFKVLFISALIISTVCISYASVTYAQQQNYNAGYRQGYQDGYKDGFRNGTIQTELQEVVDTW
jgi:hypothetical protein